MQYVAGLPEQHLPHSVSSAEMLRAPSLQMSLTHVLYRSAADFRQSSTIASHGRGIRCPGRASHRWSPSNPRTACLDGLHRLGLAQGKGQKLCGGHHEGSGVGSLCLRCLRRVLPKTVFNLLRLIRLGVKAWMEEFRRDAWLNDIGVIPSQLSEHHVSVWNWHRRTGS